MPMWQIYHPEAAFSESDKQELAGKITAIYESFLPRFYVNVFFSFDPERRPFHWRPGGERLCPRHDRSYRALDRRPGNAAAIPSRLLAGARALCRRARLSLGVACRRHTLRFVDD